MSKFICECCNRKKNRKGCKFLKPNRKYVLKGKGVKVYSHRSSRGRYICESCAKSSNLK